MTAVCVCVCVCVYWDWCKVVCEFLFVTSCLLQFRDICLLVEHSCWRAWYQFNCCRYGKNALALGSRDRLIICILFFVVGDIL